MITLPKIIKFTGPVEHNKWEDYRWDHDPFTDKMPYKAPKVNYRDNKVYAKSRN
jgi:hypothetical protein